jgi:hypothetical protein
MRFAVTWFKHNADVLPRWALELARQIPDRGAQAPPELLGPVTALRELRAAAKALLSGRPARSSDDRTSLRDDLARALEVLGPRTAAGAAPVLKPLRQDLGRLPALLSETNGALAAQGLAEAALEALAEPELAGAAWDDLCAAFVGDDRAGIAELRIRQLAELVEVGGGDWRSAARRIERILYDDRLVLADVGAVESPPLLDGAYDVEALNEPAGLPFEERLRIARAEITASPPFGDLIAWVCFRNASLRRTYLEVAGVQFFGHQMWPDGVINGHYDGGRPFDEFRGGAGTPLFVRVPEEPFVIVRIPLGSGRLTGAVNRARAVAQDLVRAASPGSEWALIDGAMIHVVGSDRGWFGAVLHDQPPTQADRASPEFEPTGRSLAGLDHSLAAKLLEGDPQAHEAVRDVEWAEALSRVPEVPQRLALGTRLIERALPAPSGSHWTEPVRRYLRGAWSEQKARQLIEDTAVGSVDLLDSRMSPDRLEKSWRSRLLPTGSGSAYTIRLDETLRSVEELKEDLPRESLQWRVAAELAEHACSSADWLHFLGAVERRFDILLARLARQRNAVLHGADTVPDVIESVSGFAIELENFVTFFGLDAAAAGQPLLTLLEKNRIRLEQTRQRLTAGEAPSTAIFA